MTGHGSHELTAAVPVGTRNTHVRASYQSATEVEGTQSVLPLGTDLWAATRVCGRGRHGIQV